MDCTKRKRPAASAASKALAQDPPQRFPNLPDYVTRSPVKTVRILSPLSGEILKVYEHYGEPILFHVPQHPDMCSLWRSLTDEHPPPDNDHEWVLLDPKNKEELPPSTMDEYKGDHIYAIMQKKDYTKKRRIWK